MPDPVIVVGIAIVIACMVFLALLPKIIWENRKNAFRVLAKKYGMQFEDFSHQWNFRGDTKLWSLSGNGIEITDTIFLPKRSVLYWLFPLGISPAFWLGAKTKLTTSGGNDEEISKVRWVPIADLEKRLKELLTLN